MSTPIRAVKVVYDHAPKNTGTPAGFRSKIKYFSRTWPTQPVDASDLLVSKAPVLSLSDPAAACTRVQFGHYVS
jgi:hypothetical protein